MESKEEKIEQIKMAIQKLILDKKNKQLSIPADGIYEDNDDDQLLLSRLLSQLDALKGDATLDRTDSKPQEAIIPAVDNVEPKQANPVKGDIGNKTEADEIVKEIRKVKRQNLITHCLLSAMIILTISWQFTEVSVLMQLKDGVNHPFRSLGSMLKGMIKKPVKKVLDADNESSSAHSDNENYSLPNLKMPEIPSVDMPEFGLNVDK